MPDRAPQRAGTTNVPKPTVLSSADSATEAPPFSPGRDTSLQHSMNTVGHGALPADDSSRSAPVVKPLAGSGSQQSPPGPDEPRLASRVNACCAEAFAHRQSGRNREAAACYREAIRACKATPEEVRAETGFRLFSLLADLLEADDQPAQALADYHTALAFAKQCSPGSLPVSTEAAVRNNYGRLLMDADECGDARQQFETALASVAGADPQSVDSTLQHLRRLLLENFGRACLQNGRPDDARIALSAALRLHRRRGTPCSPEVSADHDAAARRLLLLLGQAFEKLSDPVSSHACREQAAL